MSGCNCGMGARIPGFGTPGATFIPKVTETAEAVSLSWENNRGLPNPEPVTIPRGKDGLSAYEVAKANGFEGTEAEWLESLEGEPGPAGPQGKPGPTGADGAQGAAGAPGKSAYEYAKDGGYTGTEEDFAAKLAAENVPAPVSAQPGQLLVVEEVDSEGKITKVAPMDRTHWKKKVTMLENAECALIDGAYFLPECGSFVVGSTYDITINGTTYSCRAFDYDGYPAIGSRVYMETIDPSLPIPLFFIEEIPGNIGGFYGDMTAESITVKLERVEHETIPPEYLPHPYHIIKISKDDWNAAESSTSGIYRISNYDIRDLYSAYKAGYPVYIDIDYGEYGFKRAQIAGYNFMFMAGYAEYYFEMGQYTLPVMCAASWHNGIESKLINVWFNVSD